MKLPPKLGHLRAADGGLQPGAVVKGSVPVIDRRMIPAERQLEVVVSGRNGLADRSTSALKNPWPEGAGAGVGPGGEA